MLPIPTNCCEKYVISQQFTYLYWLKNDDARHYFHQYSNGSLFILNDEDATEKFGFVKCESNQYLKFDSDAIVFRDMNLDLVDDVDRLELNDS